MSLKEKPRVCEARNTYGVEVEAFYYQDVKHSVNEFRKELRMISDCSERNKLIDLYNRIIGDFQE